MHDEWTDPRENLFIPGAPGVAKPSFIDDYAIRQAPRELTPPRGSATANFNKATGDLVCDFKDRLIQEDFIQKMLKWARLEYGEKLTHLTLVLCADAMREYILWLDAKGFERQPDDPQSAMYAWRKELPKRKKKETTT
jgi:hypothetical protein